MPRAGKLCGKLGLPGVVIPTGLARVRRALPVLLEEAAAGTAVLALGAALVVPIMAAAVAEVEITVVVAVVARAAQPALAAPAERTAANL